MLGIALLALGGVIAGNLYQERAATEDREKEHLLFQTQIVQQIVDSNLVSLNTVLESVGRDWSGGADIQGTSHRLKTLTDALDGARTLTILDRRGIVRASSRAELIGRDFSHRDYFEGPRQIADPDMLYSSAPYSTVLGVHAMNVSRMIKGPGGGFDGVVTATLDPDFFTPLLRSVLNAPDMLAVIAHGDGHVFLTVPEREGAVGLNLDQPGSFFRRHRESGREASVLVGRSNLTGEERMLAARTLHPPGLKMDHYLVVTVGRSLPALFTHWRSRAFFQGDLFAVAVLVSCLVLFVFQRRQQAYERERAQAALALADREHFMRLVTNNIPGMVAYWSGDLRCVYANNAYQEWYGRTPEQMRGMTIQEHMGLEQYGKNAPYIHAAMRGEPQRFERTQVKADGSLGHLLVRYIPDHYEGRVRGFFVLASDVTELKITQMELQQKVQELGILATTDPLTGIGNRRHFLEHARVELERSGRYGLPLVCLMLDIDNFKPVNDTHGHDAGDEILKSLAAILKDTLRTTDIIGRLGGEEFGALLLQTEHEGARQIAERLLTAIREAVVETAGGPLSFTASIGLAEARGSGNSVEELLKRTDLALYRAKEAGRNQICFHAEP